MAQAEAQTSLENWKEEAMVARPAGGGGWRGRGLKWASDPQGLPPHPPTTMHSEPASPIQGSSLRSPEAPLATPVEPSASNQCLGGGQKWTQISGGAHSPGERQENHSAQWAPRSGRPAGRPDRMCTPGQCSGNQGRFGDIPAPLMTKGTVPMGLQLGTIE